ncbi:5-formyltetrahydrofolate cyclo-ligase [Bacillus salitolerans]|uniref:5-formyltetrahydrofolate cyclo-ligase n=1 Tax=Bacillus salitolerans TaxID=1437434 RepID=A0ABW4LN09_9BACI
MPSKKEIRKQMIQSLNQVSDEDISNWTKKIHQTLFQNKTWVESQIIGVTLSRGREVETRLIIEQAWKLGKKVAIPKCYPEQKQMVFYQIDDFNSLEEVYFGLKEPIPARTNEIVKDQINLLIVPGVCFTIDGYRIGYGGGYYDRFLENFNAETLSLLFECQLVDDLPREQHDIAVRQLLTEKRTIFCYE